jgi:hypothetical protein
VSDVFQLGVVESFFEYAGDARGFVFKLVKLSFGGAEPIGKVQAGEDGDARGIAGACATGDRDHQLIDLVSDGFDFAGIAIGQQGISLVENMYADRLLRHPEGSYLILRVAVARRAGSGLFRRYPRTAAGLAANSSIFWISRRGAAIMG